MTRPPASSPDALHRMQRQGRRDTKPELALRRAAHRLGLRYWVDRRVLPGLRRRPDLLFPRAKVAVFVDGCFWHSCPLHGTTPRANGEWWADKLRTNVDRDRDTDAKLAAAGWVALRVWEHDDMDNAAQRLHELVLSRRSTPPAPTRRVRHRPEC